ncbi:N-formylmethionylaminoacyl-tRNA deformylase [Acetobacter estunensis NRIC 0472]|uniref:Peptide deformylase-like n=1 Tax=Acetobacter estunensis TaxID=104097 RepID=A0A967EI99_9PROT|nr:peptide deformylase [Acetobacter estunensis]NHO55087.1 peptide deformylase [Acetobacter estunensis]GBQ27051.1 N-formylmethionylaminoacyl-tRNA deformylase [Acetobacter estunensis NRIC 0472]
MPVRPLVTFPDQRLREIAAPVTLFDDALRRLADDLLDTMRAAPGVGITGPHIGALQRIVVLELPGTVPHTYINPTIIWASDDTLIHEEGSVSMPGVIAPIERPARVHVHYQDLDGTEHTEEADGLRAICHQHEIDQLNGIFWTQRLSPLRRNRVTVRFEKLIRASK